jgi:UPF0716 protein FxsA
MTLLGRLALLFVVVPLIELVLLAQLGQVVGLWPTLALVIFTGVTGAALARLEGLRVLLQFRSQLASGELPEQALLDGISVLVGGALLLTPGILTDFAGFALLFPLSRRWIQRRVRAGLERRLKEGSVRVVSMGAEGFRWPGGQGGPDGPGGAGPGPTPPGREPPLDPRKGIVVDPPSHIE